MSPSPVRGGLHSAAAWMLCALFAVLAVGLALLSSGVYRAAAADAQRNYNHRTALSYLVNQLRRADRAGSLALVPFGDGDAVALYEDDGAGGQYVTLLYCHSGQLRELYTAADAGLTPADGLAILPLSALELTGEGAAVTITATTAEGEIWSTVVAPRCGFEGGAAP